MHHATMPACCCLNCQCPNASSHGEPTSVSSGEAFPGRRDPRGNVMCVKSKPTKTFTSTIMVIQENHGDHDYYDGHHHDHDGNDGRDGHNGHNGHQYPHLPEPYQ